MIAKTSIFYEKDILGSLYVSASTETTVSSQKS